EVIGWEGPNGSQIISTEIENLSSMTGFRINAWLQIEIPNATPVGSRYKLTAPSVQANGFPTISEFNINVVANAAKSNPVEPTPTRTIVAEAPLYDIDGSSLEFLIGSIKPFSFSI